MQKFLMGAALAILAHTPLYADITPVQAAEKLGTFLERFTPGPSFATVIVTRDAVLMNKVQGVRRIETGAPVTTNTPLYVASQTKAMVGLLAADLHERGILSLKTTLADHWPDLVLPGEMNPATITLQDLLTHNLPIDNGLLTTLEAYAHDVSAAHYPALLLATSTVKEKGFDYDNLGYNIYAAVLETATGKSWRVWLDDVLFAPLGLEHSSARTSDFPLSEQAFGHIWQGDALGWAEVRPKVDAQMQSAGGVVMSTSDMATFLQVFLNGEGAGIAASAVARATTPLIETNMQNRRNAYELPCSHYALGWNICDFEGHTLYIHGGAYTGMRSMMAFSPDLGVGIATFANSDNATGWATSRTINMYLQYLTEHEKADAYADLRVETLPKRSKRILDWRRGRIEKARAEAVFGGFGWAPETSTLEDYTGTYGADGPYLNFDIVLEGDVLKAKWGVATYVLQPATPGVFAGVSAPLDVPEAFEFTRNNDGQIAGVTWDGDHYPRK